MPKVRILADSINNADRRLTTYLLEDFPKCLLAELNTHRQLSRNTASSRAIPIEKVIEQVQTDPFIPIFTGKQKGMQGADISAELSGTATGNWLKARDFQVAFAESLVSLGIHKQNANRLLEPWMKVPVIVSATEWDNFFSLRCHPDAQPEFQAFAIAMRDLQQANEPKELKLGDWHVPFEDQLEGLTTQQKIIASVAKCARVSYRLQDQSVDLEKDQALVERLSSSKHMSPFEHVAMSFGNVKSGNFVGFHQYRKIIEGQSGELESAIAEKSIADLFNPIPDVMVQVPGKSQVHHNRSIG